VLSVGAFALVVNVAWAQSFAISALAGSAGSTGTTDATGAAASFNNPTGIAVDTSGGASTGTVYVADANNHAIRKITSAGVVTTLAGTAGTLGTTDGTGTAARFKAPQGIAIDSTGANLYVADTGNSTIRRIVVATGAVTTVAGTAGSFSFANGTGAAALLSGPIGLALNTTNTILYVADNGNHLVRQLVLASGAVTTVAGTTSTPGSANGTGTAATFNLPRGIAADATNLYVADYGNHGVRQIVIATGAVTTVAGTLGTSGSANGTGTAATFKNPGALAAQGANLYVADSGNSIVRQIVIATGVTTTLAGSAGATGTTDGIGNAARFALFSPLGIAANSGGTLYLADTNNQTIRTGGATAAPSVISSPNNQTVAAGGNTTFTLIATGNPTPTYQWQIQAGGTGSFANVSNSGAYSGATTATLTITGATVGMNGDKFQCVVSNGVGSSATSSSATLTVTQVPAFTSAASTTFAVGGSGTFQVTASGSPAPTFTITAGSNPAAVGITLSSAGVLSGTPTSTTGSPFAFTITAANSAGTATQNFTLTVSSTTAPAFSAHPAGTTTVTAGNTATFTVTVSGTPTPTLQWQISPDGGSNYTDLANGAITGGTVSGATTATLSIASVTSALNNSRYRVRATNSVSTVTSNVSILTVNSTPAITNSTLTYTAPTGQTANGATIFSVTTSGQPAPTSFAISSGALPSWVTLNTATGVITANRATTTGDQGTSIFNVTATNGVGTSPAVQFTITITTGPTIVSGPASLGISPGGTGQFTVSAVASSGTLSFQWYRAAAGNGGVFSQSLPDNVIYSVVTNGGQSTLTINSAYTGASMNGDQFRVVVSDSLGSTTSSIATLSILQAPAFTSAAAATFVTGTSGTTFQVQATGSPAPTLSLNAGALPAWATFTTSAGTNATTGTFAGTPPDTTGSPFSITITATNTHSSVTQAFTLTVLPVAAAPVFTTQPAGSSVAVGQPVTFTVVVTGSPTPTLQWQRQAAGTIGFVNVTNGGVFSGATTSTLTLSGVSTGMNGDIYQCVATNASATVTSTSATLSTTLSSSIVVSTFAGTAGATGTTDATGTAARFNGLSAIAIDSAGNAYVADTVNSAIRRITPAGVVTTYAGIAGSAGSNDGTAQTARFNGPYGVAVDRSGNVYVADTFNHTIRMITPAGAVTTLAGLAGTFGTTDDTGTAARFSYPTGVAVTSSGFVFVADSFNHTIRMITPSSVVSTYAGVAGSRGTADGTAQVGSVAGTARFASPNAVAVDAANNVYVADSFNHAIRKITPTATVTTLAGLAGTQGSSEGTGTAARFNQPNGLAVDTSGNVFVADTFNHVIRKVTAGGVVTTVAGLSITTGSTNGTGSEARFNQPYSVAVDSSGSLFIADRANSTVRRIGAVVTAAPTITAQPLNRAAAPGNTVTFTVAATGSPAPGYLWQRQAAGTVGYVNVANDSTYSGVTTATLTIANITTGMNGDMFQCVVSNFISPDAISAQVSLSSSLVAPTITSASSASFTAGQFGSFTLTSTGTPAATYSASGLPYWATLDTNTGVISGTPTDASGSPFTATLTAFNGASTTQTLTVNVVIPVVAPAISTQPASAALNRGATATFSVAATGTAPLTYQWFKNGEAITGANAATLTLANIQAGSFGNYSVRVSNSVGAVTSGSAILVVNLPPAITSQPRSQAALVGSTVTLLVITSGDPAPTYQWRQNGVAIAGATGSTLTLTNVQAANAGNYDVTVTNPLGTVSSSLAQLTVTTASTSPVITSSPASRTVVAGRSVSFSVQATGVPAVAYQWRKNGQSLPGETNATLSFASAASGDAGNYDVLVTNTVSGVTSQTASLKVIPRSYAGIYVGSFAGSSGNFAAFVRDDNTGVLLGFVAGANGGNLTNLNLGINDVGGFSYSLGGAAINGAIAGDGAISATLSGTINTTMAGTKSPDVGTALGARGFYQAGVANGSGAAYVVVSASGQVYALTQTGTTLFDGGLAPLDNSNRAVIGTTAGSIIVTVAADGSTISVNGFRNNQTTVFSGAAEAIIAAQRLGNISTRARVDTGSNIAIAGFVISGTESKPVLIRAIGPTLAAFGITSALGNPKLELFRGSTSIATNTVWATGGNTAAVVAATTQAGGFPLAAASADSVIFTTLPPGNYTAQVSAASGAAGVALIEVYDLSAAAAGQKLFNISTRATAGAGDATLIAGISVNGTAPKRVLIRAVGPGLAQFGLTGVLATPQLQLIKDGVVVASNTGLNTSPDAAAIAAVSAQVGAFALPANSADCALLLNLAPGNYSATVTGPGTATGLAIVEVYEVP
jgi:sugar lactone lactonase YvrE